MITQIDRQLLTFKGKQIILKLLRSKLVIEETDSTTGIDRQIHRQVDRQIDRYIDRQIDR